MLNEDKPDRTINVENSNINTADAQEIQVSPKTDDDSKVQEEKKNQVPETTDGSKNLESNTSIKESQNKTISSDNYGAAGPIIDILDDEEFNQGDESNEINKKEKVFNPLVVKQEGISLDKKVIVEENNYRIQKNSSSSALSGVVSKEFKGATDTNKPIATATATVGHFKTVAAEKKTLRSEFSKKNEVMHHHQRTNTMFTPLISDFKTDEKKKGVAEIKNLMVKLN
jgi:hypothetical protein